MNDLDNILNQLLTASEYPGDGPILYSYGDCYFSRRIRRIITNNNHTSLQKVVTICKILTTVYPVHSLENNISYELLKFVKNSLSEELLIELQLKGAL